MTIDADLVWSADRFRAQYRSLMIVLSPMRRRNRPIAQRAFRRLCDRHHRQLAGRVLARHGQCWAVSALNKPR